MPVPGMTGLWPAAIGALADPNYSAMRAIFASGGASYQSMQLLQSANASGAGTAVLSAAANGGGFGAGMFFLQVSGNSATAQLEASPDGANWFPITATAQGVNTTGTGQLSGYYPYIRGGVVWASGGPNTASVNLALSLQ